MELGITDIGYLNDIQNQNGKKNLIYALNTSPMMIATVSAYIII